MTSLVSCLLFFLTFLEVLLFVHRLCKHGVELTDCAFCRFIPRPLLAPLGGV